MFEAIGRFDVRFRWLIIVFWIAGAIIAIVLLPTLSSVTQSSNARFLSSDSPSVRAGALAAPFEGNDPSSTMVIVAEHLGGSLTAADDAAFAKILQAARQVPQVAFVRDEGESADGRAHEALVGSRATAGGSVASNVVDGVRATFGHVGAPGEFRVHLTGPLAENVDFSNSIKTGSIARFSLLLILVLLFIVFRSALAPFITLIPAGLAVAISGPLVAEASRSGLSVSPVTQQLLIVLLLGAGTDYGLFLVFRVREELSRQKPAADAVVAALAHVGESVAYSALTVIAALLTLLLASFGIYRDLGPALAIGVGVMLLAALTLTPALLAISGRVAFWPSRPSSGGQTLRLWGALAERVVQRPFATIALGVVIFGGLAAGIIGYRIGGYTNSPPANSDSAIGAEVIAAHFPRASVGSDSLLLRFPTSLRADPGIAQTAERKLAASPVFAQVTGPSVSRSPAQFISPDGHILQLYASLSAGPPGSSAAIGAIGMARAELADVAKLTHASDNGVAGQDASSSDIGAAANSSLADVVPVVLIIIFVLLGLLLRSLVAPWYLVITVGLSYLAALGFAMIVFVHLGTQPGLNFVLPFLMFVFAMALGEDYNILVMSRIREEAHKAPLRPAITHAMGITGGTITSAGIILAGTFGVLGAVGGNSQAAELGFSIAFGVLLDTFFVRTLLVPSIAMVVGRWNWWPARLAERASDRADGGVRAQLPAP